MRHDVGPRGAYGVYRLQSYENRVEWRERLKLGIKLLQIPVQLCYWCHGEAVKDGYTCVVCDGTCLHYEHGSVAPISVTMQIYNAGVAWKVTQ